MHSELPWWEHSREEYLQTVIDLVDCEAVSEDDAIEMIEHCRITDAVN